MRGGNVSISNGHVRLQNGNIETKGFGIKKALKQQHKIDDPNVEILKQSLKTLVTPKPKGGAASRKKTKYIQF